MNIDFPAKSKDNAITLIRHGQTDSNLEGIWQGHIDNPLNETGIKLTKRIDNQFNFFERTTSEDVVDLYINSIALSYGPHTTYMSPKRTEDFDDEGQSRRHLPLTWLGLGLDIALYY